MKRYFVPNEDIEILTVKYTKGISYRITKDITGKLIDLERAGTVSLFELPVRLIDKKRTLNRVIGATQEVPVVEQTIIEYPSEVVIEKKKKQVKKHIKNNTYKEELP